MNKLNVLAIGAHPDDPEILCGGTLAQYAKLGHNVFIAYLTDGSGGGILPGKKLSETRRKEGKKACDLIGAGMIWGGLPDAELVNNLESRGVTIDVIRQANPDVIITHFPDDQNADHRITSVLVQDANNFAVSYKIKTKHPRINKMAQIYFMESTFGVGFTPTDYVDITDVINLKRKMCLVHASQFPPTRNGKRIDVDKSYPVEWIYTAGRYRAYQVSAKALKYAEAFQLHTVGFGLRAERLLP